MKQVNIKNGTYYFFNDMINIKSFDSNRIKIDKTSYKNILIYYIEYITIKNLSYVKTNNVNLLYLIINKIDEYIEESNGNKYLTLRQYLTLRNYLDFLLKELWDKIKDLMIKSITYTSGDYDKKYMKIKFNSDGNLLFKKILKLYNLTIVVRSVFEENKKYYPQLF